MTNYMKLAIAQLLDLNRIELLQDIDSSMFTGNEKKLYDLTIEHYKDASNLPTRNGLQAIIETRAPASVKGQFAALVEGLPQDSKNTPMESIIEGLKEQKTLREVDSRIESLIEAQRDRRFKDVKNILSDTLLAVGSGGVKVNSLSDTMFDDEVIHGIPSGFGDSYDELIGGSLKGVSLFAASSGGGKSAIMLASAIEAFKAGESVLFVSLELSARALGARLTAYLTDIDFTRIIKGTDLSADEQAHISKTLKEFWGDRRDDFKIVTDALDDQELLSLITVQAQTNNVKAVYIDYLGLVGSSRAGDSWKSLSDMVKTLHKYTIKYGLVVVTAAQVSEAKITGNTVELTSRGSQELVFSSSMVFYVKHNEDGESATIFQVKNRYAKLTAAIFEPKLQFMKFIDLGIRL